MFEKELKEQSQRILKRQNSLIKDGKRTVAEKIRKDCSVQLYEQGYLKSFKLSLDELVFFVLTNLQPAVETVSVKRTGQVFQVPQPVKESRSKMRAIRQLLEGAKKRSHGKINRYEGLGQERVAAYEDRKLNSKSDKPISRAVEKRNERYRIAKANRVNSHMRQR